MRLLLLAVALSFTGCSTTAPVAAECPTGLTRCAGQCVDLALDASHCGSCGLACGAGEACAQRQCLATSCEATACEPGKVCFEGQCSDRACIGVACPAGQRCSLGACACASGRSTCNGQCVDTATDDANCGGCGRPCAAGTRCAAGTCLRADCQGQVCDELSVCVADQCVQRACLGVVCPGGQRCNLGACECPPGRSLCNGQCVDTALDDANCGGCGKACSTAESCAAGTCLPDDCSTATCDGLSVCVGTACVERACVGKGCATGLLCSGGVCACPAPRSACGSGCADTQTDSANCGSCGRACAANEACAAGACFPRDCSGGQVCDPLSVCFRSACTETACVGVACPTGLECRGGACFCQPGRADCSGQCADLQTSTAHCGACGRACTTGQTCTAGACANNACAVAGQRSCGGTCTDTTIDPANCGQCGDACGGGRVCVGSQCQCPQGRVSCGGSCVDTTNDTLHCGSCSQTCINGTCSNSQCTCPGTLIRCNGVCVDVTQNANNCGSCGRVCAAGSNCSANNCTCPSGQMLCGGSCIPVSNDNLNCGACGRLCGPTQQCVSGTCQAEFTCQLAFNDSAFTGCQYWPLSNTNCGAVLSTVPSSTVAGATASTSVTVDVPLTVTRGDRVNVAGYINSSFHPSTTVSFFGPNKRLLQAGTPNSFAFTGTGSGWACSNPTEVSMTIIYPGTYSVDAVVERLERYNSGSIDISPSPALRINGSTGRTCDQVCGDVRRQCGDDRLHYLATIPAGKALAVGLRFGGLSSSLNVYKPTGQVVCSPLVNQGSGDYRVRVVNNTATAQQVVLAPVTSNGPMNWQMGVASEP